VFDLDRKAVRAGIAGAITRTSRATAESALDAAKHEVATATSLDGALDRVTARAALALIQAVKSELASLESDLHQVNELMSVKRGKQYGIQN
jgi:hypothetical protein